MNEKDNYFTVARSEILIEQCDCESQVVMTVLVQQDKGGKGVKVGPNSGAHRDECHYRE